MAALLVPPSVKIKKLMQINEGFSAVLLYSKLRRKKGLNSKHSSLNGIIGCECKLPRTIGLD